jgi:hypothetical protein
MRLNVLAGCRELLEPTALAPDEVASLIGPDVRLAPSGWIEPRATEHHHDFLQEGVGDRRVAVMAAALREGFGERFQPLLVLADLLDEIARDVQRIPPDSDGERRTQLAVLEEILELGRVSDLYLYALAIPSKADPDGSWAVAAGMLPGKVRERIEHLRGTFSAVDRIETRVVEVTPDYPLFDSLYMNAISNRLVHRIQPRLLENGWRPDAGALATAISVILSTWSERGILPGLPLTSDGFDQVTDLVYERLLQG